MTLGKLLDLKSALGDYVAHAQATGRPLTALAAHNLATEVGTEAAIIEREDMTRQDAEK